MHERDTSVFCIKDEADVAQVRKRKRWYLVQLQRG